MILWVYSWVLGTRARILPRQLTAVKWAIRLVWQGQTGRTAGENNHLMIGQKTEHNGGDAWPYRIKV
jgi:hypothetical protein